MPVHSSLLAKPKLLRKLKAFYDHLQKNDGKIGTFRRGIEMNYNNACNLRCKYCFTNSPKGEGVKEFLPQEPQRVCQAKVVALHLANPIL